MGSVDEVPGGGRNLLVLDHAFDIQAVRSKSLEPAIASLSLDGFFDRVWNVHALGVPERSASGRSLVPSCDEIAPHVYFVQGSGGRGRGIFRLITGAAGQIRLLLFLVRIGMREGFAAVRVGDPYYLGALGAFLSLVFRAPLIVRVNADYDNLPGDWKAAYPRLFRSRRLEKLIERMVFRRADLVAGATQQYSDYALANGARPGRVTVFAFGALIDPVHLVDPLDRQRHPEAPERYALCVSRLEPLKLPLDAIDAVAKANRDGADLSLVMVGDGSLRTACRERAEECGLGDRLLIMGERSQREIAELLAGADLILSPLTGRALVEAAFAGQPIVAYDTPWQRSFLLDGECGLLVPFADTDALASALGRVLNDGPLAAALGAAVLRRARETMDPAAARDHERRSYLSVIR